MPMADGVKAHVFCYLGMSVVSHLITLMHLYLYKITRKPAFVFGDMMRDGRVHRQPSHG
jgi:hypothetical protein